MNLQEWAFVADIIAAAAVVLSLCFLAWQIRLYTRQARHDALDLVTTRRHDMLRVMADDGELASIVWRGFAGTPRLPPHEWARFGFYIYSLFLETERAWVHVDRGTLDSDVLENWEAALGWWLRQPGVRAWWKGRPPGFTPAYTRYIEGLMSHVNVDPAEATLVAASFRGQVVSPAEIPAVPAVPQPAKPRSQGPGEG